MHVPYTYLIGWKELRKFYYGVRYSKGCHPSDLFVEYFTSSDIVKKTISEHGIPDIIQIRKTFHDSRKARQWETKVLKKMNVVKRNDFLNQTDRQAPPIITSQMLQGTYVTAKGDTRTNKQKLGSKEQSKKMTGRASKKRIPITILGENFVSFNAAIAALKIGISLGYFIRNNDVTSCNTIEEIERLRSDLRRESRKLSTYKHSDETRKKLSMSSIGKPGTRNGVITSQETKNKLRIAHLGRKVETCECPHCLKRGGVNTMKRWHFDNCINKV